MANTLVTPAWVMKTVGVLLVNEWRFANNVNRDYDSQYSVQGCKVGDTVKMRLPQRYVVTKGQNMTPTAVEDRTVDIKITDQAHIGLAFSMMSLTLEVDDYRNRYLDPAVSALVNTVDYDGLTRSYQDVFMTVGTPGVIPGSTGILPQACNLVYQNAVVKLQKGSVPGPYNAMIDPLMQAYVTSANMALFNPSADISKAWKTGQFGGEALGIRKWFMDQNVAVHTVGPLGGTPLVDGAGQTGSAILTKGWTSAAASRLLKGDVIQFAGVKAINLQNYQTTGQLADFTVTTNFASDASGNGTVNIYPPITTSGNNQTVTASPADSAAITIFGHASSYANVETPQGLVYHRDAFALVFADIEKPEGIWVSERISNKALGVSVRFVKDYTIMNDQSPARLDMGYGWNTPRPEMAARVCS